MTRRLPRLVLALFALILATAPLLAKDQPAVVKPEDVGLSAQRLARIDAQMEKHVTSGDIAGAMGLIARHGKVAYLSTWGYADREARKPMRPDTIFRIYSMSKPITSVAVMILYEEGRFFLTDPVSKYLPELAELEVQSETIDPVTGVKTTLRHPAENPITIRDLLRHTAGLTYGFFGDTDVDRAYREQQILLGDADLADLVKKLGELPLLYEPGTRWHYSVAVDVLGRLIEVVSGKPFDAFLEERLFEPLGMTDTGFWVPPDEQDRLAQLYSPKGTLYGPTAWLDRASGERGIVAADARASRNFLSRPAELSGGGGMVSTAGDYLRFCQMMLNGGELDGVRILSRKSVELMTTDHLGDIPGMSSKGYGFGLGFGVAKDPGEIGALGSAGEYNWGGAAGTRFWVDPKEDLIGIFMVQILPHPYTYGSEFKVLTYQAIDD